MLGFWQEPGERKPVRTDGEVVLLDQPDFTARRFRLEILPGLWTYAVELVPRTPPPHPGLLAQHGYGGSPELVCGLVSTANDADYAYRSLGIRSVRRGFRVVAVHHPTSWGALGDTAGFPLPGFPQHPYTYGKNRLHRMAIMAGGALFGLDMMGSSRGIDYLLGTGEVDSDRVVMYGLSQGGQSAMYLPGMDTRLRASVASAYFNARLPKLIGPQRALTFLDSSEEDKFFPDVVRCFGDADLVSLIAPRAFAVEAGLLDSAVDFERAREEFARAAVHWARLGIPERAEFIPHREGHVSATGRALDFLCEHAGMPGGNHDAV
jgi:dienelactone hydrolase